MNETRDDRVLVLTMVVAASVILVLLLAFLALYIFPTHTDIDFAWTILPGTSALLIGAGYTAGAYFFARLLIDKKWHRVQAGFLPITAFTLCMLIATLLHLDRFHKGAINFDLWTVIYIITPFLVPYVWWRNQKTGLIGPEQHDVLYPSVVKTVLKVIGLAGVLVFIFSFVQPAVLISLTPWKLTPLTARIFSGWSILTLGAVASIGFDGRWSATRILMESAMVGITLCVLALPRMWSDFKFSSPMAYALVGGLVLTLIVFIVLHLWLDRLSHHTQIPKNAGAAA